PLPHAGDPALGFFGQPGLWTLVFFPNAQLVSQSGGALVPVDYASRLGSSTAFPVPSRDGSEYFGFEAAGRHVTTRDTVTGVTLATLAYTGNHLTSITDVDGNQLTIERPDASTIVLTAPFGQK